ncbi:MAG: Homoserine kinase [uncultured bacterium]|nr:MAG: Homoserine kinase [uncultured bacterium]
MALYSHLTDSDINELCQIFSRPIPQSFEGVLEGTVNTYYKLSNGKAGFDYLKIDEVGDRKRLDVEVMILDLLKKKRNEVKFLSPEPHRTPQNKAYHRWGKKFVLIMPEIAGKSVPTSKLTPKQIKIMAEAMSRMHVATEKEAVPTHRFNMAGLEKVFREISIPLLKKHPTLHSSVRDKLRWLKQNEPKNLPSGVIHADLFAENVLFKKDALSGILDFEASGSGAFLFDICVVFHALCHDGKKFNIKRMEQFIKGYEKIRKLTAQEKEHFDFYLQQTAMRFLLTRLRDFELKDGMVKAAPFKDYKEYEKRYQEIVQLLPLLKKVLK